MEIYKFILRFLTFLIICPKESDKMPSRGLFSFLIVFFHQRKLTFLELE